MNLDKKEYEILKKIAKEKSKKEQDVLDAIESFFESFDKHFNDKTALKKLLIHNFGTFYPQPGAIKRRIRYLRKKDNLSEELEKEIEFLEKELERIINNKHIRNERK